MRPRAQCGGTGAVRPANRIRFTVDGAVELELPRVRAISVQHRSFVLERWIALLDLYLCRGPKICLWNSSIRTLSGIRSRDQKP